MTKIILTTHAQERLKQRSLSILGIEQTVNNPDKKISQKDGKVKFIKQQGSRLYQVIGLYKPEQHAWLIVSVWIRGEEDKPDLIWRLISWPFKMLWQLLKFLFRLLFGWN